jgi:hypothetical protein
MTRNKMTFDQVFSKLERINDNSSIEECVNAIRSGDILFSPGIIQEKSKLASLYKLRVNMKKNLQKDKFTPEELDNWDLAVDILNEYECEFSNLNIISTSEKGYFLFWDNKTEKLITSFWLINRGSIKNSEKNNDLSIERGHTVSSIKYSKTEKVKDWLDKKNDY